ncbi:MAG TPA: hypothetical protein VK176_02355 [Phycisphaerales bacterium]|nr:hypothetical protein [Phycisphaerales bacterium]
MAAETDRTQDGPDQVQRHVHTHEPEPGGTAKALANSGRAWAIGLNFVYGVIGFGLIGWALERWVWPQAAPWIMLSALGLGLLGGGVRFVREAIAMGNRKASGR